MHQGALLGAARRKAAAAAAARRSQYGGGPAGSAGAAAAAALAAAQGGAPRGKVTARCLWNACKALTIGLLLMAVGCAMATIGYYAESLSMAQEVRGNSTVPVKNESRTFHLNNLSYAGPIVMGVGGFIVVAACVMTFEARDSAAKVTPARFKLSGAAAGVGGGGSAAHSRKASPVPGGAAPAALAAAGVAAAVGRSDSRRSAGCQTRFDAHPALFRTHSGTGNAGPSPAGSDALNRSALTAAFLNFSRALHHKQLSVESSSSHRPVASSPVAQPLAKSPSAPDLPLEGRVAWSPRRPAPRPAAADAAASASAGAATSLCFNGSPAAVAHLSASRVGSPSRVAAAAGRRALAAAGCSLLSPYLLPRQALSVDCYSPPGGMGSHAYARARAVPAPAGSRDSLEPLSAATGSRRGSQASMALDLHLPNDCVVTLHVRDQTPRRSETARRHQLLRQRPVEDEPPPTRARANTGESLAGGRFGGRRGSGACLAGAAASAAIASASGHRRLTHSRSSAGDARPRRRSHLECPRCAAAAAAAAAAAQRHCYAYGAASPLGRSPDASPRSVSRENTDDTGDTGTAGASPRSGSVAISIEESDVPLSPNGSTTPLVAAIASSPSPAQAPPSVPNAVTRPIDVMNGSGDGGEGCCGGGSVGGGGGGGGGGACAVDTMLQMEEERAPCSEGVSASHLRSAAEIA